jgi:hypothetical protein
MTALIKTAIMMVAAIPILVVLGGAHLRVAQGATSIIGFTKLVLTKTLPILQQLCLQLQFHTRLKSVTILTITAIHKSMKD